MFWRKAAPFLLLLLFAGAAQAACPATNTYPFVDCTLAASGLNKAFDERGRFAAGMACDSVTDDTAALQTAINASYGSILQLPSSGTNTCLIQAGQIVITGPVVLQGQGKGSEIGSSANLSTWFEVSGGSGDVFSVQTTAPVEFRDFALDVDDPHTSGACFALNGASGGGVNNYNFGSTFEHLNIGNFSGTSCYDVIRVDEGGGFTIRDVFATGTIHDTLLVVNSLNPDLGEHFIYGNYFWDSTQATGTEASNPFATTNTSPVVTVTRTAHGLVTGKTVTYPPQATFNNVTISGPYTVTRVDANHFTITAGSNANATGSGGGASVKYTNTQNALIEYQSSLDSDIFGNKLNGGAYGILVNLKNGPTGSMRVQTNSIENAGYQEIALTQGTSGAEGGNVNITGNQFSSVYATATADLFVGTGTPNLQAKWLQHITFIGNIANDHLAITGTSAVKVSDGTLVNVSHNILDNGVTTGATGIAVLSGSTHVLESGNTLNFATGNYGTMNAGSFDSFAVNGTAVTVP